MGSTVLPLLLVPFTAPDQGVVGRVEYCDDCCDWPWRDELSGCVGVKL